MMRKLPFGDFEVVHSSAKGIKTSHLLAGNHARIMQKMGLCWRHWKAWLVWSDLLFIQIAHVYHISGCKYLSAYLETQHQHPPCRSQGSLNNHNMLMPFPAKKYAGLRVTKLPFPRDVEYIRYQYYLILSNHIFILVNLKDVYFIYWFPGYLSLSLTNQQGDCWPTVSSLLFLTEIKLGVRHTFIFFQIYLYRVHHSVGTVLPWGPVW